MGRRLRRILTLLPYTIRNPGVSLDELSERFGVDNQTLVGDFNLMFLCGLPGYGPGDLIEAVVEDDRVYVSTSGYFEEPLRITPAEALSLYTAGAALVALPGMETAGALRRGLDKLGRALLGGEVEPAEAGAIEVQLTPGRPEHMTVLQDALASRLRVHLEYFSASRAELTTRDVDPWGLVATLGRWYLIGWDHLSEDERMFRVDRIKSAVATESPANVPTDFDPARYRTAWLGEDRSERLRLEISPQAATWFEESYPVVASAPLDDGWTWIEMTASGERWTAMLLLRLSGHVRAISPEGARRAAEDLARAIAAAHA